MILIDSICMNYLTGLVDLVGQEINK